MGSYKDYQENMDPLRDILNRCDLTISAVPHSTLPISKSSGTPSKPKIKNIQYFDGKLFSSTSASELEISERPRALITNKFERHQIIRGMPPNLEQISQPNPSTMIAEAKIQHKVMDENASPAKRQRLEKVDDANDICIIEEKIKRPRESTGVQPYNEQAISPATIKDIPTNSTICVASEVPPKVADTPRGLEREEQNNGTHTFARNRTQNDDEEFSKSLKLDNIKLREKELTRLQSYYRNNVDGITLSEEMQELKKKINMLKQDIERSKKIRSDICESKSFIRSSKYTCKKCNKEYEREGNIVNHILAIHPEIPEEYKPAQINDAASTVIDNCDETSSLTSHSHSIHSQLTLLNNDVLPHRELSAASSSTSQSHSIHSQLTSLNNNVLPPEVELSAELNIQGDNNAPGQTETNPVGKNISVSSRSDVTANAPTKPIPVTSDTNPRIHLQTASGRDGMVNAPTESLRAITKNPRAQLQTAVEMRQDNPFWKRNPIKLAPRKSVDFLGHKSFELFENHERMVRNWIKKNRSNSFATGTNKTKNSAPRQKPNRNNLSYYDGSAQLKKYYLDLTYTKAELDQINHCYMNKNTDFLCEVCVYNLAGFQAKQYAVCKAAYDEHEKITKDRSLSNQEKKRKLKELVTKDEYRLIRDRLKKVNETRGPLKISTYVVIYNESYFLLLQEACNDLKIRDFVELDRSNLIKYNFGIYCSKLMDDIVNEFLVQVTVICMNFAYQERKVTLTKELLTQYQAFFKMTNKDATYLEPCSSDVKNFFKKNYSSFLPTSNATLEVLIIDCLLRHCFSDENAMHESLDDLIFEHLKSPQPIFKFLMYMKFTKSYLDTIRGLLLEFLFQLSVEILKLKKELKNEKERSLVNFEELIKACEIVGVFGSSYIHYLRNAYTQFFRKNIDKIIYKNFGDEFLTNKRTIN